MLLNELIGNEYPQCSKTNGIESSRQLFKEAIPYTKTKRIDGSYTYIWDSTFIKKVVSSLESGNQVSFSAKEQQLFDMYIRFINNGISTETKEEVLALDKKLGEII